MNAAALSIFCCLVAMVGISSPRWGAVAVLLGAICVTRGQMIEIGPANLTIPRLLVLAGLLRIMLRGEGLAGGVRPLDWIVVLWSLVMLGTSIMHTPDAWVFRSGAVLLETGSYFLFRVFLRNEDDVRFVLKATCVVMLPVALLMLLEKQTAYNVFGLFGGVEEFSAVRNGYVRASGPFVHPILAGTVGAACFAIGIPLWRTNRLVSVCGLASGALIVYASASSGPILMVFASVAAYLVWHLRHHMRWILLGVAASIGFLSLVMNDPVYFLVARIDISGGSTGYFRAQLIRSSLEHISEWWLAGTDHTRHWMPSGIGANDYHTDITNHLLWMGVLGGLPLLFAFLAVLARSFRDVGNAITVDSSELRHSHFLVWSLGAILFGFFVTFWSITLFDQSVVFFWLVVASIQCVIQVPCVRADTAQLNWPNLSERGASL